MGHWIRAAHIYRNIQGPMINRLSSQKIGFQQLKSLARLEVALAVLVLALGAFAYNLYQQAQEAQANQVTQDRRLAALEDDLIFFDSNNDKEKLQEELRQLRSTPAPPALPPYRVALSLGNRITEYAQSQDLPLTGFDRIDFSTTVDETEYSAVKFTVTVVGDEEQLTGMLELLSEFPTAMVRTLEFIRPLAGGEGARGSAWQMTFNVDVIYR